MKCLFCGAKASLFCDSHLGWERLRGAMSLTHQNVVEGPGYFVPLKYRHIHTCDAALCAACAVPSGTYFCRMKNHSFADSIDYCPGHDFGDLLNEITGLQAQAMRARWKAQHSRGKAAAAADSTDQLGLF